MFGCCKLSRMPCSLGRVRRMIADTPSTSSDSATTPLPPTWFLFGIVANMRATAQQPRPLIWDENSYLLPYHIRNSSLLMPAFDSIDRSNPLPTCFRSGTTTFLVRDWKIWWDPLVWTCLNPRVVKYLTKSRDETSGSFCTIRIVLLSN